MINTRRFWLTSNGSGATRASWESILPGAQGGELYRGDCTISSVPSVQVTVEIPKAPDGTLGRHVPWPLTWRDRQLPVSVTVYCGWVISVRGGRLPFGAVVGVTHQLFLIISIRWSSIMYSFAPSRHFKGNIPQASHRINSINCYQIFCFFFLNILTALEGNEIFVLVKKWTFHNEFATPTNRAHSGSFSPIRQMFLFWKKIASIELDSPRDNLDE